MIKVYNLAFGYLCQATKIIFNITKWFSNINKLIQHRVSYPMEQYRLHTKDNCSFKGDNGYKITYFRQKV